MEPGLMGNRMADKSTMRDHIEDLMEQIAFLRAENDRLYTALKSVLQISHEAVYGE